ncbi:hypothetical protein KIW84_025118 [Lathyrus oleraceus]|uniref:Arabidopsis retrotransposon Orf1 C-terminal domain-containing protein n=1 Tax=Pisum sativum TaxID=3888 RepID=A0A9D5BCW7_PEA|nr:hypothetical protein KIW84_025118 [Pisum sativum]
MLNNLGMSQFFSLTNPTYIRLTYEFLSSFRYTTPIGGLRTTVTVDFRMFNRSYDISQNQRAELFSFPYGDEYAFQHPLEREWESNALDFWQQLTDKTTTDWEGLKATTIHNPTIRYLHRILTSAIFDRENTGNTGGLICVGGLIISIALALNLSTELATLEPLETPFVELDYFRSMRLIKNKPDGKYFLMISNREVRGVTLPCAACIDVRMSANWTFDLLVPEPDHMEKDAPQASAHVHTKHAFPNSFLGTSFGYQPREEYDYTAMRTTLDDILSELRHHNDVDADCDVLLRNIQRQQDEMMISINQIRETQLDFVERTELNMGDLTEQMNKVHMEVSGMREYIQHVPHPAFGKGGIE